LAEIPEARHFAEMAIRFADSSGHRPTLRAAHTNLGNIIFSSGELSQAEDHFQIALACCEVGSVHEIAILDNIAQTRLQGGDLAGCKEIISRLEECVDKEGYSKRRHYLSYALQTKIRLLLAERQEVEALQLSTATRRLLGEPRGRMSTEAHLLEVDVLIANNRLAAAAQALSMVCSTSVLPSPDLFAKMEFVSGRVLASFGSAVLAKVHLARAARTFYTIGHSLGTMRTERALESLSALRHDNDTRADSHSSIDRVRALLDLRMRPELFGYEARLLLEELGCARNIELVVEDGGKGRAVTGDVASGISETPIVIAIKGSRRTVTLSFVPLEDPQSRLTAKNFQRIISQLSETGSESQDFDDREFVWPPDESTSKQGFVFASDAMLTLLKTVKRVAPTDVSILVTGETGTGKEVIARTIHDCSRRSSMPFLALNCAAVPRDLLESQLFGHRKGAFSGALENHLGVVRAANGGTLFLDEIGDVPLDMQAKLLRFLEQNEVHPIGEAHPVRVNVRLVFATNGDLEEAVGQNRFRQDLYYRLNVIPLRVPPLRERREEIPILANAFARRFACEFSKEPIRFATDAMELLILYAWPGNVRQLANEIRRLAALADPGAQITPAQLSKPLQAQKAHLSANAQPGLQMTLRIDQSLEQATARLESEMIKHAMQRAGGRVAAAASTLGISRKGLYLKRLRLGLIDPNLRAQ
jgi:DNA-binding NtrC family response regulator